MLIYQTNNFIVESPERPLVSRIDGGHIRIRIIDESITDRTKLNQKQATELMRLTMIVGEALEKAMNEQGVGVVKINYQDMGNWAYKTGKQPFLHIHIFDRARDAKYQIFPEAVYLPDRSSGFYDSFEPLSPEDVEKIRLRIEKIFNEEKYSDTTWSL